MDYLATIKKIQEKMLSVCETQLDAIDPSRSSDLVNYMKIAILLQKPINEAEEAIRKAKDDQDEKFDWNEGFNCLTDEELNELQRLSEKITDPFPF